MGVEKFMALQKANALFDGVVSDMRPLQRVAGLERLVAQQLASADSIAANIEEGYGRGSVKEYRHFLIIARGSAQETRGRYVRMRHWLPEDTVRERQGVCDEIIALLTSTITTLGKQD